MNTAIINFPGSNCDQDCFFVFKSILDTPTKMIWHQESSLGKVDLVVIPGGFSYGDYLRAGALSRVSPVMNAVREFAKKGGYVIGICNGFQILLENKMLPGAMLRNQHLEFRCQESLIRVSSTKSPFTSHLSKDDVLCIPIAHAEGNYYADKDTLKSLQDEDQIVFQYSDMHGNPSPEVNPNGSLNNIAGIINKEGNILGMMPHPERASESLLGSQDGKRLLEGIVQYLT